MRSTVRPKILPIVECPAALVGDNVRYRLRSKPVRSEPISTKAIRTGEKNPFNVGFLSGFQLPVTTCTSVRVPDRDTPPTLACIHPGHSSTPTKRFSKHSYIGATRAFVECVQTYILYAQMSA